ncbi:MAG: TROVE domain-containing protein [Deltaproteobacteria bacterium]|nr:TROVE domain-containing protein [Deltaproteobacteria bacterium]
MAKFATREAPAARLTRRSDAEKNYEGGLSFSHDERALLLKMASCCLVNEGGFYGDTTGRIAALVKSVARQHPEWIVKLAVYLRQELNLRSVPQLVAAIASGEPAAQEYLEKGLRMIALRPDDLIELAALVKDERHGIAKSTPQVIRKFIRGQLNTLDEYRALKYRRTGSFGLRHLLRLYHPRPANARQNAIFKYIADKKAWSALPAETKALTPRFLAFEECGRFVSNREAMCETIRETELPWELIIPRAGSFYDTWEAVALYMPVMALIRNLRNLHKSGALKDPQVRRRILDNVLRNKKAVLGSKQLPFRWLAAWREMKELDTEIADALIYALELSVNNVPGLKGPTFIACDTSGSMAWTPISRHSSLYPIDICCLVGAMVHRRAEQAFPAVFAEKLKIVPLSRYDSIMTNYQRLCTTDAGTYTFAYKILKHLLQNRWYVDTIIILTDMVIYGENGICGDSDAMEFNVLLHRYRKQVNPGVKTYIINLQPYSCFISPCDDQGVTVISGWSENILKYIQLTSGADGADMVGAVESIRL